MRLSIPYGEVRRISKQWAQETERTGATISTSAWTFDGGTVASETLVTPLTTALVTPTTDGLLINTVTLSNGETRIASWDIEVC